MDESPADSGKRKKTKDIFYHVKKGNATAVEDWLRTKYNDVNIKKADGSTLLSVACYYQKWDIAWEIITAGYGLGNAHGEGKPSPIELALRTGQRSIAAHLIKTGSVDVNMMSDEGESLLWEAACSEDADSIRLLLERGANPMTTGRTGSKPSQEAKRLNNTECVTLLKDAGRKWKLQYAAETNDMENLETYARRYGVDTAHSIVRRGRSALGAAAAEGHEEALNALILLGADVNFESMDGETPLHFAAKNGRDNVVPALLESGADVTAKTRDGWTPLYCAAYYGHAGVVRCLVEVGADIATPIGDKTPLFSAAQAGAAAVVRVLLTAGADPTVTDALGQSPLMVAMQQNDSESVRALIEAGAPLSLPEGHEPVLCFAAEGNLSGPYMPIVRAALRAGADINEQRQSDGNTALHVAAAANHVDVIRLLLEHKANLGLRNNERMTASELARSLGNDTAADVLDNPNSVAERPAMGLKLNHASGLSIAVEQPRGEEIASPIGGTFPARASNNNTRVVNGRPRVAQIREDDDDEEPVAVVYPSPTKATAVREERSAKLSEREKMEKLFREFDVNGDGTLSAREVGEFLRAFGHNPTRRQIREFIATADPDGNGKIDFEHLALIELPTPKTPEEIRSLFTVFDTDGNGFISAREFKKKLQTLGEPLDDDELERMFRDADVDGSGDIDVYEFAKLVAQW